MRTKLRRLAVVGTAVAALTAGAAVPALADPSPAPSGNGKRAEKLCGRLPQVESRLDKVLARLKGGPDEPGSVEFVKKRAERARANGNTELATALDSRAKARADMIPVLEKRRAKIPELTDWCAAHGHSTGE
jgi:hypothetical protein